MGRARLAVAVVAALLVLVASAAVYAGFADPQTRIGTRVTSAAGRPAVPEVLRAQKLQLVTPEGEVWAEMGIGGDGVRGLTIYDAEGNPSLELVVRDGRGGLYTHEDPSSPQPAGTLTPSKTSGSAQPQGGPNQPPGSDQPGGGLAPSGGS